MAEKRVSVRLAAVGGRQVRTELEGVGEAGAKGFGRLSREMDAANQRLAAFSRRAKIAVTAAAAALAAGASAMVRSGLQAVDAQAKLAQSLGTTVASMQTLERAGELAGVSMSGIEQATKDLTRRLSQAAAGTGPAITALDRLGLSATDLMALPLDQRVGAINAAIEDFVPAAEQAAVAGQLFGEEGSIAMARIDTATLRQATADVHAFGVVVSEQDANQIERTNDAISRLGLIWRGLSNQLAVAVAPALEAVAAAMAAVASRTGPLGLAIRGLFDNLGRIVSIAGAFAGVMAGRWVVAMSAAALSVRGVATALVLLRGAIIRTGWGALIVGAGELIYQFGRLVAATGGVGAAMQRLGTAAGFVLEGIRDLAQAAILDVEAAVLSTGASVANAIPGLEAQVARLNARAQQAAANAALLRGAATDAFALAGDWLRGVGQNGTAEPVAAAAAGVERLNATLEETAAAARRAGAAGAEAGQQIAEAAEPVLQGWASVADALAQHAREGQDWGKSLGSTLVGAFSRAEDAVAQFVTTGKLRFSDLVTSVLADLARLVVRQAVTGPLASLLSAGISAGFGAIGRSFAGGARLPAPNINAALYHSGGVAGGSGPLRLVGADTFTSAPRLHSGGVAGLRPDEVPAILQRGERVLSLSETRRLSGGGMLRVVLGEGLRAEWLDEAARQSVQIVQEATQGPQFTARVAAANRAAANSRMR